MKGPFKGDKQVKKRKNVDVLRRFWQKLGAAGGLPGFNPAGFAMPGLPPLTVPPVVPGVPSADPAAPLPPGELSALII